MLIFQSSVRNPALSRAAGSWSVPNVSTSGAQCFASKRTRRARPVVALFEITVVRVGDDGDAHASTQRRDARQATQDCPRRRARERAGLPAAKSRGRETSGRSIPPAARLHARPRGRMKLARATRSGTHCCRANRGL